VTNADIAALKDPLFLLWKIARMWLVSAVARFGSPALIATLVERRVRRVLTRRVVALETLVMKLLLVEAARLGEPPSRHSRAHAEASAARRAAAGWAVRGQDSADPGKWRVRFQLRIPPEPRPPWISAPNAGPRIRDLGSPLHVRDIYADKARRTRLAQLAAARAARSAHSEARERTKAARLARRFEALKRTIDDPAPHARRLLRKLAAFKERAHAAAMRIVRRAAPPLDPEIQQRAAFYAAGAVPALLARLPTLNSS